MIAECGVGFRNCERHLGCARAHKRPASWQRILTNSRGPQDDVVEFMDEYSLADPVRGRKFAFFPRALTSISRAGSSVIQGGGPGCAVDQVRIESAAALFTWHGVGRDEDTSARGR